jgi:hypothetical protein
MITIAGPEQNALARNLGARIEAFQKGRAARPLYRKAVTVCMPTAHGIESKINGITNERTGSLS